MYTCEMKGERIAGAIFDYGRTLCDPETHDLFSGTLQTLESLRERNVQLGLVSIAMRGTEQRYEELVRFGILQFFQAIHILALREGEKDFAKMLRTLGLDDRPHRCLVVGDNLARDIAPGNLAGAYTVHTRQRLFRDEAPKNALQIPRTTIDAIEEVIPLVDRLY